MEQRHWRTVDDLVLPQRVAGHPALELVNTFSGWDGSHASDYLATHAHLTALAADLGLVPGDAAPPLRAAAEADPGRAARSLEDARRLRAAVRAAALDPADPTAVGAVSSRARRAAPSLALEPGDPPRWRMAATDPEDLDLPVDAFAWAAAELLTTGELHRVRACPGLGCGWVFLDTSGRRRWCDMRWCGNRAKVRAHARRHRPAP